MRCPNCRKFVSQDTGEPQVDSLDLDGNEVTAAVTISAVCAECSGELKSGQLDLYGEFDQPLIDKHQGDGHELEVEEDGIDAIDEYQTKDRRGKPIKNPRYQTHLYGAQLSVALRCSCQAEKSEPLATIELQDTMPASSMDEMC